MKDLAGQRFGSWEVLEFSHRAGSIYYWLCRCDCGVVKPVRATALTSGISKSCGHIEDLTGRKFGRLIVTKTLSGKECECICDCGKTVVVKTNNLKSGNTTSCGCKSAKVSLVGQRFGNLVVEDFAYRDKTQYFWGCRCDCGETYLARGDRLKQGITTCCENCYNLSRGTHRKAGSKIYKVWSGAKARCHNKSDPSYGDYGARGIYMCGSWRDSFEKFYADMGDPPTDSYTLDRIDNSGPYSPENCHWATLIEQANNKRNNRNLFFNGEFKTLAEWARELNMAEGTISSRIDTYGWSVERALSTPSAPTEREITFNGETMNMKQWAEKMGFS